MWSVLAEEDMLTGLKASLWILAVARRRDVVVRLGESISESDLVDVSLGCREVSARQMTLNPELAYSGT